MTYFLSAYLFIALCIFGFLYFLKYAYGRLLTTKDFLVVGCLLYGMLLFNILYTAYFGWNTIPKTKIETMLDTIHSIVFILTISATVMIFDRRKRRREHS